MKLKYVDIYGFKSFADKTKLVFNKDISAIVGPNGSGKSNISDAVRWVLGEQSAKSLRGLNMQDVIFSGTETKKQMNMAQVSITLDNSDKSLPIAFDEVNITRRVYRTGESEYLINNSQVRLKDVKELFLDTGIGKDGYSIIGQGRIDDILNGRNEDKRYIFEEACGISKNKYKKIDAERKLVKNEENLEKLRSELKIKEQEVEILKKQSENAKEGIRLTALLEKLELSILKQNLEKLEIDLEKDVSDLEFININLSEKMNRQKFLYERIKPTQTQIDEAEKKLESEKEKLLENKKKYFDSDSEIKLLSEKIKFYKNDIERIGKDIENRKDKISKNVEIILEKRKNLSKIKSEIEKINKDEIELDFKNKEIVSKKEEITKKIKDLSEIIASKKEELSVLNINKSTKEQMDINNNELKENYILEIEKLKKIIEEKKDLYFKNIKKLEDINKIIGNNSENISKIMDKREKINRQISILTDEINSKKGIFYKKESEKELLYRMYISYDGFNRSVQNLLKAKNTNPEIENRIVGVLADLIKIDKEYKIALDVSLASSLQNILVKDEKDGNYLIDYIKKNNLGRITFLPISKINADSYNVNHSLVINTLDRLVEYDSSIKGIINHFLSRTLVVKDMKDAVRVSRELKGFRVVTIDGEIINSWGSMVGGNIYKKENSNLINRKQELDDLTKYLENIEEEIKIKESELLNLKETQENIVYDLSKLDDENKKNLIEKNIISTNLRELEVENTFNQNRLEEFINMFNKTNEDLKEIDFSKIGDLEKEIIEIENKYLDFIEKEKEISEKIIETEKNRIKIDSNLEILNRDFRFLSVDIENIEIENENYENSNKNDLINLKSTEESNFHSLVKIEKIENLKNNLISIINNSKKEIEIFSQYILDEKNKISKDSKEVNILNEDISELEKNKYKLEFKIENSNSRVDELYHNYTENYGEEKNEIKHKLENFEPIKASKKDVLDIKSQLSTIGYFNFESIEKYNIENTEFEFIQKQLEDLESTKVDILNMIKKIEKEMIEMFNESFYKINEKFSEVFKILFDGGDASLVLDSDDVLNAGIEISAKPPGKKLKNLGLLSGGEKALTAVALLFAIFEINPAPFCVLDEIDAALDESNISRYIKYLHSMTEKTQFIMITHRKVTMEMAQVLYGVTMEEKGISKVITLSLDKYARG